MLSADEVAREDLLTFLNAAFVSTGQAEFLTGGDEHRLGLGFLHDYVRGNYRRLYARLLAVGVNHFNVAQIIIGLLSSGRDTPDDFRSEENALLRAGLRSLPPQRAWKLMARLRREGVNNRRTRALIRDYIAEHSDLTFHAVKYRRKMSGAMRHAHLHPGGELADFLFGSHKAPFDTPILERYRQARFSKSALHELPFSVAQGLAAKHGISPDDLLKSMEHRLTERERLRVAGRSDTVEVRPERLSLTELASYVLGVDTPRDEIDWLAASARAVLARTGALPLTGKVAAVLDNSFSSSGSREKRRRPLAVAWGVDQLLRAGLTDHDYRAFWTHPTADGEVPRPRGQTNLTERLIDALEWGATTVLVVSDGAENDPPGVFHAALDSASRIVPELYVLHVNPVFDPQELQVSSLSPLTRSIGLRNAEDLPTALGFARYVTGHGDLAELEAYLERRVQEFLEASAHA